MRQGSQAAGQSGLNPAGNPGNPCRTPLSYAPAQRGSRGVYPPVAVSHSSAVPACRQSKLWGPDRPSTKTWWCWQLGNGLADSEMLHVRDSGPWHRLFLGVSWSMPGDHGGPLRKGEQLGRSPGDPRAHIRGSGQVS